MFHYIVVLQHDSGRGEAEAASYVCSLVDVNWEGFGLSPKIPRDCCRRDCSLMLLLVCLVRIRCLAFRPL